MLAEIVLCKRQEVRLEGWQRPEYKGPGRHGKEFGFILIATAGFM